MSEEGAGSSEGWLAVHALRGLPPSSPGGVGSCDQRVSRHPWAPKLLPGRLPRALVGWTVG